MKMLDESEILLKADVRTTDELKKMFVTKGMKSDIQAFNRAHLQYGFQQIAQQEGAPRSTATFGVHAAITVGAIRTPNMDNWPKPLVNATIDFERKMLALVDAAQPIKVDQGIKLNQELKLAEQPYRTTAVKVTYNGPKNGL